MKLKEIIFHTVALTGWIATAALAGDIKDVLRYPLFAAPRLADPPTIDGMVDKREWYAAALLPRPVRPDAGIAAEMHHRLYVACDETHLYLAFQFERPANARVPQTKAKGRDAAVDQDDHFELSLDAGHAHQMAITLRGNAAGAFWEEGVKSACRYAARATPDDGWEGEIAIPFAALDRQAPTAGEVWGFSFVNIQRTPVAEESSWAFASSRQAVGQFSHLVFPGFVPAMRFEESAQFATEDGGGLRLALVNVPGAAATEIKVAVTVLRRKPDAAGGSTGYLLGLTQALTHSGLEIILPTDELDTMIKEQLAKYTTVTGETARAERTVTLSTDQREPIFVSVGEPGEYLLRYNLMATGAPLAAGVLPFRVSAPLQLAVKPFFLAPGIVQARIDLRRVPEWKAGAKLKVTLARKSGGTPLAQAEREFTAAGEVVVLLPAKDLPPGGYAVSVELFNAAGQRQALLTEGLSRPETPEWMLKPAGVTPAVPPPWKPIQVRGRTERKIGFLMGEYDLADSVWPKQIAVRSIYEEQRRPILRGPMTLQGRVNGKPVVWSGPTARLTGQRPEEVGLAAETTFENLQVKTALAFEYDGMAKVSLNLTPLQGQPQIDELYLDVPLVKEHATLYLRAPTASAFYSTNLMNAGAVPLAGLKHEFVYSVWLGDEERGFRWFAENMKGWHLGTNAVQEAIEVRNGPEGVTLRINFIKGAQPFPLAKEREIVFGYMFTPPKTIRRDLVNLATTVFKEYEARAGVREFETWYYKNHAWPEVYSETERQEKLQMARQGRSFGIRITPFSGWFIHRDSNVYALWGGEMTTEPVVNTGCGCDANCWNTSMQDAYIGLLRDRIRDTEISGFRLDAGFSANECSSLVHRGYGSVCGWHDDQGRLMPSRHLFAVRRAAQRAYRLFHDPKAGDGSGGPRSSQPDGVCIQHIHLGNRYDPILANVDAVLSCEGREQSMNSLEELPMDFYRANVMGDAHGYQVVYLPKSRAMGTDSFYGLALLHNFTPRGSTSVAFNEVSYSRAAGSPREIWRAREWIGPYDPGTEFWGYWKNSKLLQTSAKTLLGSFHVRRGEKLLLGIMNLQRQPVEGKIKLDLPALGFTGPVYAFDPILQEPLVIEGNSLTLTFAPEGYRAVQIANKPFPIFVPEKISENLIPEAAPARWAADVVPSGWQANKYVDETKPLTLDATDVSAADGGVRLGGDGSKTLRFVKAFGAPGKYYMLEAEATIACDSGAFLGPFPDTSQFAITLGDIYLGHKRSMTSQPLPGTTQKFRLFTKDAGALLIVLRQAKGHALIKKLELYEVKSAPPGFQFGRYGQ